MQSHTLMNEPQMADTAAPAVDIQRVLESAGLEGRRTHHVPKATLFRQGDEASSLLYIESGHVTTSITSAAGREVVVALLTVGDFVGESCLAGHNFRLHTARAVSRTRVLSIDRRRMAAALRLQPAVMTRFIAHVLKRNVRIEQDMADQLSDGCEKRLARVLWLLSGPPSPGCPTRELPAVSQQSLAEMVGTSRSHVNRFMNKFRRLGLIDYADRVRVSNDLEFLLRA